MLARNDGSETVKITLLAGVMLAVPCSCLLATAWLRRSGRRPDDAKPIGLNLAVSTAPRLS